MNRTSSKEKARADKESSKTTESVGIPWKQEQATTRAFIGRVVRMNSSLHARRRMSGRHLQKNERPDNRSGLFTQFQLNTHRRTRRATRPQGIRNAVPNQSPELGTPAEGANTEAELTKKSLKTRMASLISSASCALSSVVEHYLHTVGVAGSKPAVRTIFPPRNTSHSAPNTPA